ncbi:unnamed protein product, partial [Tetraodon nigroviridis]
MSLLPRTAEEFSSADYWERFFKKRGDKSFEWYGDYNKLCGILHKYIKIQHKVLVVGCGNSELSEQLYDVGYKLLTNIDISETVITHMNQRNSERRPGLNFQQVDATRTPYEDASFQAALDKGTLDAMASEEEGALAKKMLTEVGRVLSVGGRYVCITLAQESVIQLAVEHFVQLGWAVRLHCLLEENGTGEDSFALPVFVLVCTKFRQPMPSPILEMCVGEDGTPVRLTQVPELLATVREHQAYSVLKKRLRTGTDASSNVSLTLCHAKTGLPRYTLAVQDCAPGAKVPKSNHFAIFIVPQGSETAWLYSSSEGRKQLAASANFRRLVVVTMHRNQEYTDMQAVQSELSPVVMDLHRQLCHLTSSGFLCCSYQEVMVAGLAMLEVEKNEPVSVLLVGLGGGALAQFLRDFVPNVTVEVVELDPVVLEVATEWFGFRPDHRLTVTIGDGLERISALEKEGGHSFDVIIFDVDNKDSTLGMSGPPPAFVETLFLQKVYNLLSPKGIFILNLVCRNLALRQSVLEHISAMFPSILSKKIEEDVNEVLLCS